MRHKPMPGTQLRTDHHWSVQGLKLFLPLSMGGGLSARDLSGNNNHGEIHGATWVPGPDGPALYFDGDDYVDAGIGTSLDLVTEFTLSSWIKTSDTTTSKMIIVSRYDDSHAGSSYMLWFGGGPGTVIEFYTNAGAGINLVTSTNVRDGKWHHVLGTYNRGSKHVYIDGVEEAVGVDGTPLTSQFDTPVRIGWGASLGYFDGLIDNVSIYNIALTASQARELSINPHIQFEPEMVPMWQVAVGGTIYYATPSDSLILSESITKSIEKVVSDDIILSELTIKSIQKPISDSLILSESTIKSIQKSITDTAILSDSTAKSISKIISDSMVFSDSVVNTIQKAIDDSTKLSDSIASAIQATVSDSIVLSDSTVISIEKAISDNMVASDSVVKVIQMAKSDSLSLSDSVVSAISGIQVLLWHYTDVFLSLLRSVQRAYDQDGTGLIYSLTVYDYLYITEIHTVSKEEPDPT